MHEILESLSRRRVAVIGDLMLDSYLYGAVNRISPEAPAPIVRALSERSAAGGGANVAANLAALGVNVDLVGLVGRDEAGGRLTARLREAGTIGCEGVIASHDRRTTLKMRIVGGHQQMMRIDHEDLTPCCPEDVEALIGAASAAIRSNPVVIFSDYGKGVFSDALLRHCLDIASEAGAIVIVDPKRPDFSAYRGATILTPNRKELHEATGIACEDDAGAGKAAEAAQKASGAGILLTRSEKGMSYFPLQGTPLHLPTVAQEVFDVSGAGDTVVAVLAAGLAAGAAVPDAIRLANRAAGLVVSKFGAATVTREELAASLKSGEAASSEADGALVDWETAAALRWAWAREKLTVGLANGCFDLLHAGHISLIRQAAENCDRLIVALNSDASVARLKGPARPIQDESVRAAVMGAIKGVAAVVIFGQDTPLELIEALQPDVLVKGADYTEDRVVGAGIVRARGGRVVLAELSRGQSTSKLIARANKG
jgi:D-beta-D-heptose 7-phosphate kinase/D-beta-D-heptose 1-phosphate adenosyltransferase